MDGLDGWVGWMDGWLSLYDGLLRAPTVLITPAKSKARAGSQVTKVRNLPVMKGISTYDGA